MFTKFCAGVSKLSLVLAVIGLIAVILCVQYQVIGRYIFNDTPTWAESGAVLLVLYVTMLGMAVGGNTCCEWMKAQGDVARALAEKNGWDYVELSNNNDPATALKNAQIFYFLNLHQPHVMDLIMQSLFIKTQSSPFEAPYFSCVPYLLGEGRAMQYSVWPKTNRRTPIPTVTSS
mgnify:CR=1 FL=1